MAINVVRYERRGQVQWGVLRDGRVTPVPGEFPTTGALIGAFSVDDLKGLSGGEFPVAEAALLSPVTRNQQFICQGANYRQHMIESGMNPDAKKFNMIFRKASSCIVAADSPLIKPAHVRFLDYEVELGLVMKRDVLAKTVITDANLHEFVAGVVIVNDYSARDVQIPQMQFYKGKSYRSFGPVGPYLCLLERADMPKIKALKLTLKVNDQIRQQDSTANMVFGPAETLTELSGLQDLHTGDLIATGTPHGCALSVPSPAKQRLFALLPEATKWKVFLKVQAKRPQYLKIGDSVETSIVGDQNDLDLGVQRNRVVEEQP